MGPFQDNPLLIHEDTDFFREAVLFTAGRTGMSAALVEKDYFCSVLLAYLYQSEDIPLVFKGGTSLSKIYADFYRMSEDLDFLIPMSPDVSRSQRRGKIAPVKELLLNMPNKISGLQLPEAMRGHNNSKQYIAYVSYTSTVAITDEPTQIEIEVGLRESLLAPPVRKEAKTLLINPFNKEFAVPKFNLMTLSLKEAYAEKLRAALSRRGPAIRDFYDIDYAVTNLDLDLRDSHLIGFVIEKLKVPGNDPINISNSRKSELRDQLDTQLKPVLRPQDFENFDFDRAFDLVAEMGSKIQGGV